MKSSYGEEGECKLILALLREAQWQKLVVSRQDANDLLVSNRYGLVRCVLPVAIRERRVRAGCEQDMRALQQWRRCVASSVTPM